MGKILGFWIPLLAKPSGTRSELSPPLTLLGDQHVDDLEKGGIPGSSTFMQIQSSREFWKAQATAYHEHVSSEKTENRETNPVLDCQENLLPTWVGVYPFKNLFVKLHFPTNFKNTLITLPYLSLKLPGSSRNHAATPNNEVEKQQEMVYWNREASRQHRDKGIVWPHC